MDSAVKKLEVILTASTAGFTAAMGAAGAEADGFTGKVTSAGQSIGKIGSAIMPMSLAAGAALAYAAKSSMDFEGHMLQLQTQANLSATQVSYLKDKVLELAPAVGFGPDKLAQALYPIASAGITGAKAMDTLKYAAEGAQIGGSDLVDTTNALVSTMKSGIPGAANSAHDAMASLNAIVGAGRMHMQDLNDAISTGLLSTAGSFGVSLNSVGAALATMTNAGIPAVDAATKLRQAMVMMAAPSAKAITLLKDTGLTSGEAVSSISAMNDALTKAGLTQTQMAEDMAKPNGLTVAFQDLNTHLAAAGVTGQAAADYIMKAFGGAKTGAGVLLLDQQVGSLNSNFDTISKSAGNFDKAWAKQQQDAATNMAQFNAQLQTLAVQLGANVVPALTTMAKSLGGIADAFGKLTPGQQQWITWGLVTVAFAGPVLKFIELMTTAWSALAWVATTLVIPALTTIFWFGMGIMATIGLPFEAAAAIVIGAMVAIGLAAYMLIFHFKETVNFFAEGAKTLGQIALGLVDVITGNWAGAAGHFKQAGQDWADALGEGIKNNSPKVENAATGAINKAVGGIYAGLPQANAGGKALIDAHTSGMQTAQPKNQATATSIAQIANGSMLGLQGNFHNSGAAVMSAHGAGMTSQGGNVANAAHSVVQGAQNAAQSHQNAFQTIGSALMQGLQAGINAMGGNIVGTIGNVITGAINAAKQKAGVKSPSTVFAEIGQNIGQGMVNGINGMKGAVASATKDMVNVPGGISPTPIQVGTSGTSNTPSAPVSSSPYTAQGVGGGGGGGVTINVNMGVYAGTDSDLRSVARNIYIELQRIARANGSTLPNIGVQP